MPRAEATSAELGRGATLGWAARRPEQRRPLVAVATAFYLFHAAGHVFDVARGFVDAEHWVLDLPGVYFPAAVLLALSLRLARRPAATTPAGGAARLPTRRR